MKLYNRRLKRSVEKQIHFAPGKSVHTACGLELFSRHVMVSIFSNSSGEVITNDIGKVTCKNCLRAKEFKIRKLTQIESALPGVFDHPALCGEEWLLNHALDVERGIIEKQTLSVTVGDKNVTLKSGMESKDRQYILRNL